MFAIASPSDTAGRVPGLLRSHGRLLLEVRALAGRTVRGRIEESGPCRVRFPRSGSATGGLEAVLLNTGGGIAGGDSLFTQVEAGPGTRLTVTTQAAEKIYRSDGAASRIEVRLVASAGAALDWMPQASILFDAARVERSIEAAFDPSARLLLIEPVVLGRTARGERMMSGRLFDRWRVRRGGRLVYADGLQLDGGVAALLDRPALAAGAAAFATVLLAAPDAESRLDAVRQALGEPPGVEAGASAWDGLLSVRLLARDGAALDAALRRIIAPLGVAEPPRIWHS
ncbi:MAG TPA: urease accessory protein UreD [Xanthobacteraceae bacterium]|nr:urease accessory protein UreD [Xanthobacteraceae bacterium]